MSILVKEVESGGRSVDIYIEDGLIVQTGRVRVEADIVLSGKKRAVLPGFVNTHTHSAMTVFRGWADDMDLDRWLKERIWPMEANLNREVVYWGARLACLEMVKSGTTTFSDMYFHPKETARAAQDTGTRAYVGPVFLDRVSEKSVEEFIEIGEKVIKDLGKFSDLVSPSLSPHAIYTCSKEMLQWVGECSREKDIPVQFHLLETRQERIRHKKEFGESVMQTLESADFLQPHLTAAHSIYLSKKEISLLGEKGVNVSFNPVSNMKLATGGVMDVGAMEKAGVNITLGTDGAASNNSLSMLETMKLAALSSKSVSGDTSLCDASSTLCYATTNGARSLSLDSGRLEEGALADIILVDLEHVSMQPRRHSFDSSLVYSAEPDAITDVICNGELLMRDRDIPGSSQVIKKFNSVVNDWFDAFEH